MKREFTHWALVSFIGASVIAALVIISREIMCDDPDALLPVGEDLIRYLEERKEPRTDWARALPGRPPVVYFWYRTSPRRLVVSDLSNARFDSWVVSADWRRYLRTGLRTAFALRGYAWLSGGARPQRITVGGSYALRGYPRFAYVAGSRVVMGNVEWRFPLADYLSIGFPVGEFRLPGVEAAFFGDLGKAWTEGQYRAFLGAWGLGLRMSLGAPFVLRLDIGRRFALGDPASYSLPPLDFRWRRHGGSDLYGGGGFVDFWFGFDY